MVDNVLHQRGCHPISSKGTLETKELAFAFHGETFILHEVLHSFLEGFIAFPKKHLARHLMLPTLHVWVNVAVQNLINRKLVSEIELDRNDGRYREQICCCTMGTLDSH